MPRVRVHPGADVVSTEKVFRTLLPQVSELERAGSELRVCLLRKAKTVGETREHEPYDRIDHRPRRDVLRGLASRTAAVTSRELKVANGNLGELPIPERGSARDRESMDET